MGYEKKIQEVLSFISENLEEEITLEMISARVFCSKFHFHRIFEAYVGQTIMEYIKDKRLIKSVNQLINTDRSIIDIGLEAGFEYQQSFTRAFKDSFGFTPSVCRKKKKTIEMIVKTNRLGYLSGNIKPDCVLGPEIVVLDAFEVIGVEGFTTLEKEKPRDCFSIVPALWEGLLNRIEEIKHITQKDLLYAICTSDWSTENNIGYMAAVPVTRIDRIPPRMIGRTIPRGRYAKFTYQGYGDNLLDALDYIFGAWLLCSRIELSDEIDMAIKFESYEGEDANAICEILVPIKG